ncbi:type 1 glutamine amidotransferase [bacterium]|nr:type 1 glutamine amidotransferase [bacterium]
MRTHWLQHVEYEGLGALAPRLAARGIAARRTLVSAGEPLPTADAIDFLVVLGGPMSVNDEATLPWLAPEKALIRDVVARGVPVLGICLGAQLMAAALGAAVGPSPEREVGWWPVEAVPPPPAPPFPAFPFPARFTALHWHGEAFALPVGAVHLACSAGCPHQGLQVGPRAIGLQFHPEADPDWVRTVLAHSPGSLASGPFVMRRKDLLADLEGRCAPGHTMLDALLGFLIGS